MRVALFAGMAALSAAAENYDDDDLTFLRMLQGNGSNGTTLVPTTLTPTTVVSGNATTVAATTVVSGNATTVLPTTVVSSSNNNNQQEGEGTTMAPLSTMCEAATYTAMGFNSPGTLTQTTKNVMITCSTTGLDGSTEAKSLYKYGDRAFETANLAKCTSGKVEYKCAATPSAAFLAMIRTNDPVGSAAHLERCCSVTPSPRPSLGEAPTGTLKQDPTLSMSYHKAAGCFDTSVMTTAEIAAFRYDVSTLMTENPKSLSGCTDGGYMADGAYLKITACNSTAASGAKRMQIMQHHYESTCTDLPFSGGMGEMSDCSVQSVGGGNGSMVYAKATCSGGTAVTELEIKTTLAVTLTGLGTMTVAQKDTCLSTTCNTVKDKTDAATGAADATTSTVESCTGTGALALATYTARRVRRRLASHSATVNAVIKSIVPAAQAATIQATLTTAAASGTLATGTLAGEVVTALQAETSIASAVGNITVTTTASVSAATMVTPTAGGGSTTSSTSGAFTQALSAFVGFMAMGALLI